MNDTYFVSFSSPSLFLFLVLLLFCSFEFSLHYSNPCQYLRAPLLEKASNCFLFLRCIFCFGSGGSVRITSAQLMLADVRLEGDGTCGGIEADVQDGHDSGGGDDSAEVHDSSEAHDSAESGDEHDCEALNVGPLTGVTLCGAESWLIHLTV